jgi:hypothetical protein
MRWGGGRVGRRKHEKQSKVVIIKSVNLAVSWAPYTESGII